MSSRYKSHISRRIGSLTRRSVVEVESALTDVWDKGPLGCDATSQTFTPQSHTYTVICITAHQHTSPFTLYNFPIMHPAVASAAITALVYRAWSKKSLTPVGILTAFVTAIAHAVHPWSVFFVLLAAFFLLGTAVTKVRYD